eukprot:TRINITY_DN29479_c0_g1_i1.p1 TRINITY_DN29479_c0_g1~~TRINITY_DN29479_c0_g1_i1.p1  ORF type:complete len:350 (-),score=38.65 TRINITY_DN29479_c0_g1_i1:223-1272(-)
MNTCLRAVFLWTLVRFILTNPCESFRGRRPSGKFPTTVYKFDSVQLEDQRKKFISSWRDATDYMKKKMLYLNEADDKQLVVKVFSKELSISVTYKKKSKRDPKCWLTPSCHSTKTYKVIIAATVVGYEQMDVAVLVFDPQAVAPKSFDASEKNDDDHYTTFHGDGFHFWHNDPIEGKFDPDDPRLTAGQQEVWTVVKQAVGKQHPEFHGAIVAYALANVKNNAFKLAFIETAKKHRRRGIASNVMLAACFHAIEDLGFLTENSPGLQLSGQVGATRRKDEEGSAEVFWKHMCKQLDIKTVNENNVTALSRHEGVDLRLVLEKSLEKRPQFKRYFELMKSTPMSSEYLVS